MQTPLHIPLLAMDVLDFRVSGPMHRNSSSTKDTGFSAHISVGILGRLRLRDSSAGKDVWHQELIRTGFDCGREASLRFRESSVRRMRSMEGPIVCPKNYVPCPVSTSYDSSKVFVLMPFREEQAPQRIFSQVLENLPGWTVLRADSDFTKPEIWCKVCANIQESRAVIADLSAANANVFLELGLTWGLGRPFVLLAQDVEHLPFDTKSYHIIEYKRDPNNPTSVLAPDDLKKEILRSLSALPELLPSTRVSVQTPDMLFNMMIADAKSKVVGRFWHRSGGEWKVVGVRKEACKIALVLLRTYPGGRTQAEISLETGLHSGSVSRILTGARGDYGKYFESDGSAWRLSDEGAYWMAQKAVPALLAGNFTD